MRNRKFVLYLIVIALLEGCVSSPPKETSVSSAQMPPVERNLPYDLSTEQSETVKKFVTASLKDPLSALFGDMRATKGSKEIITVCGFVNAKNSFGGYTGSKLFMGLLSGPKMQIKIFSVVRIGGTESDNYVVAKLCENAGINLR